MQRSFCTMASTISGSKVSSGDNRGAVRENRHDAQRDAETVKKRNRQAETVVCREPLALSDGKSVVDNPVVREHDALWEARGSRGVLHVHDVVRSPGFF